MGILDWLGVRRGQNGAGEDGLAAETLDRIVHLANPRLVFARRYRRRLTPPVRNALNFARGLVARAATARAASTSAWQSDRCIRAMFATPQGVAHTFSRSPDVRAWFAANPEAQEVCAVLSMQLVERRVLGAALEDGVLRRDVAQTTVSFTDHRVRFCGGSEAELRENLQHRIVEQLALTAVAQATHEQTRRGVLEQERALLRTRLKLLAAKGAGVSGLGMRVSAELGELTRIQLDLAVNEENLKSLAAGFEDLEHQLECLETTLMNPAKHFYLAGRRICLDNMNVMLPDDSTAEGTTLDLQIARVPVPEGPPELRTFVFVRCPRAELVPRAELLRDAARVLN